MRNPNPTLIGVQGYLTDERLTQKGSAMLHTMSGLGGLSEEAAALLSQAAERDDRRHHGECHVAYGLAEKRGHAEDVLKVRFRARSHQ